MITENDLCFLFVWSSALLGKVHFLPGKHNQSQPIRGNAALQENRQKSLIKGKPGNTTCILPPRTRFMLRWVSLGTRAT